MYFSSNIKLLRKHRGRTQDDVAFALGMKRSTLSGYENEISEPNIDALVAFSKYFGIAIDTLVKIDLNTMTESQLSQLERGYDVHLKGSNLRVLATTINQDNNENIELVTEKPKPATRRDSLILNTLRFCRHSPCRFCRASANTALSRLAAIPCCPFQTVHT